MNAAVLDTAFPAPLQSTQRYARVIEASKRIRWDIDRDVIRNRKLDFGRKFLPDGLSLATDLAFLSPAEQRFLSQVQGRTYANLFGLVERYIGAKLAEVSREHALGDQVAFEALVRFTDEELKHQELFRRVEQMTAAGMPAGYRFKPDANTVAATVLSKSTWAVLALTLHNELFTQAHYRSSIEPDAELSELWKDVFLFHWKEESQHAILDELEWVREDGKLTDDERDRAVDDLIGLIGAVDGLLRVQAGVDVTYFLTVCQDVYDALQITRLHEVVLAAYRWQYILSGAQHPRFNQILGGLVTPEQGARIARALEPLAA